ncbi:cytochrome b5-like heme/steroid binding domain-containing protein [Chytriomyces sp. MP71]|nr:cytochrome b5-like heme/steroid binding domain-containing protein [Chytriomyces sp. MP71]
MSGRHAIPWPPNVPTSPSHSIVLPTSTNMFGSGDYGERKPPGNRTFTAVELAEYNGADESKPIYLALKSVVYDVTSARKMYAPGTGYSIFAGKDASRALGMSSMKPTDCVADFSTLNAEQMETLDKWVTFYQKKYDIVGVVKN